MNNWISVENRLPEKNGAYLCTIGKSTVMIVFFTKDTIVKDIYGTDTPVDGFYNFNDDHLIYKEECITAWMPLPEPYDPEQEEKEDNFDLDEWIRETEQISKRINERTVRMKEELADMNRNMNKVFDDLAARK